MRVVLIIAVFLLAFANGSNDNCKGVATLRQSAWFSFRRVLLWATAWTLLGSLVSLWLAGTLVPVFSGAALIAAHVDPLEFVAAVAAGAALTVSLASGIGMPVSTTHALLGALSGTALLSAGWGRTDLAALGTTAALPLLVSPLLAMALARLTFPTLRRVYPVERDCVCVVAAPRWQPAGAARLALTAQLPSLLRDTAQACAVHSPRAVWRGNLNEALHWMSSGWISFSRGVNDTAKIAALLLLPAAAVDAMSAFFAVALAVAAGGLFGARRVARTISEQITPIPVAEGAGANLATALLVTLASPLGLAVSTTHVSVGALFGVAQSQGNSADWGKVRQILLSWLVTLPLGAMAGALFYSIWNGLAGPPGP